jgi:hypothetical protein
MVATELQDLETTGRSQNLIQDEIKRRLNSGNACYHSVQNHIIKMRIYKTIILPVVLYGCETWFLTLREEHSLRVFENRVLRRIFGPKRDEMTREWSKLHNEELRDLYSSPNILRMIKLRRMRWAGDVAHIMDNRNAYRVLMRKPEENTLLENVDIDGRIILKWILDK